jgi:hypothetical protein
MQNSMHVVQDCLLRNRPMLLHCPRIPGGGATTVYLYPEKGTSRERGKVIAAMTGEWSSQQVDKRQGLMQPHNSLS